MAQQSPTKTFFEGIALAVVVLLPLTAVIWVLNAQSGQTSSAPVVSTPAAATTQPVPAPASVNISLDNPNTLPQAVSAGQIVPFSFTLTNTGSAAGSYSYKVYVVWNSGEQDVIDENSVALASGASQDISESLKFESASASGKIYIQTIEPAETINFTLPR
jgi:hypothetical protein